MTFKAKAKNKNEFANMGTMKTINESQALMADEDDTSTLDKLALPKWLDAIIPPAREPYTIDYANGKYVIFPPGSEYSNIVSEHDNLVDAYDDAHARDNNDDNGGGLDITDNVPEVKDNSLGKMMLSVPTDNSKFLRALIFITDAERLNMLKYRYYSWLKHASAYKNNPDDFMLSYTFVDSHPSFWTHEGAPGKEEFTYNWNTEDYANKLWIHPTHDDDDNIVFMAEAGSHVPPDYTTHYHDLRLDVYADSYENAISKMAAKVHKFFAPDGSERENVEYEKSHLELLLEERMKDVNAERAEER